MFEITEGDVLLAHLNTRTEKHGDEDVGAIDLKITCLAANTILDAIDPHLRPTFFQRAGGGAQADMHSPEHLPQLVFPHIPSIAWDTKLEGYTAIIGEGLGLQTLTLDQVKVHKFKFECVDGGTVKVTYTLSCNPTPEQVSAVFPLNGSGIILTLKAPKSDGAGAAKIKDEAVRQKQAEEGQPDILDVHEQAEKERADAVAEAWGLNTHGEYTLLEPAPAGEADTPDTDKLVTLLAERGYEMTTADIEDPEILDDPAYSLLLAWLRGGSEIPPELEAYKVQAAQPIEPEPEAPAKPDKKPRKGKTVD